jgi:hypothetical protein
LLGWQAYNDDGEYVGRIEKGEDGIWRLYDRRPGKLGGAFICWSYNEARRELQELGSE